MPLSLPLPLSLPSSSYSGPRLLGRLLAGALWAGALWPAAGALAQAKPPAAPPKPPAPPPDVLILNNGDVLHGQFVSALNGTVTFHTDPVGNVTVTWDKIRELHTSQRMGVIDKSVKLLSRRKGARAIPVGAVEMENQMLVVHPENANPLPPMPVASALYIIDQATLDREISHHLGLREGWNGSANLGTTIVTATTNLYTVAGGISLVRTVPTVSWLTARNRTTIDFLGSFGKITQPGYLDPTGAFIAPVTTKTSIYHADAERGEYFSPRFYVLGDVAFDHNFSLNLDLQQVYGVGIGWTAIKTAKQTLNLKGTIQYERQQFITALSGPLALNLVGSTFAVDYSLHTKILTYTQDLQYLPAYNTPAAYSASETNTVGFPAWKNLGLSLGTVNTYLNNPPLSVPPTRRNSFQFTMGLTYTIKSKY